MLHTVRLLLVQLKDRIVYPLSIRERVRRLSSTVDLLDQKLSRVRASGGR